ncbi:MAG: SpaA isopeptide-forming pilin-related protein [Clostridia bacterium]
MKKIIKSKGIYIGMILCIILVQMMGAAFFQKSSAAAPLKEAHLYEKGDCGELLKYKGKTVTVTFVVYQENGKEYPAYCLDKSKPGVGENGEYTVNVNQVLTDNKIWRVITNGYPYIDFSTLGCANEKEAFTATKLAVYDMLYGYELNDFTPIGEAGERTYQAFLRLVDVGRNGTGKKVSSNLNIQTKNTAWVVDEKNPEYVSKTYEVKTIANLEKYQIVLEGEVPENTKITDQEGKEMNSFQGNTSFCIKVPIQQLTKDGSFDILAKGNVNTKAIFYGTAPNSLWQDYAVTSSGYEIGEGKLKEEYSKNNTKIVILKQDKGNQTPLEGAEFEVKDENQNSIKSGLITNQEGKVIIEKLMPGKYFLEETKAPYGYSRYEEKIPFTIGFNEELTILVKDSKEGKTEVSYVKNTREVEQEKQNSKIISKLPKTGM